MSSMTNKRGRPSTGRAKSNQLSTWVDDETIQMAKYICDKKGVTKADMLKESIRMQYNLVNFLNESE